jgi:thiol-disulfide isomerase/thioredoxin
MVMNSALRPALFSSALARALGLVAWLAAATAAAVETGGAAPAFALPDAAGKTVALADLRGQVVYVDFWASWCGPCKQSFPWMNAMQQRYGAKGLAIVAVNVDKRRADADRFLAQLPAGFPVVFDPAGATPAAWDVKGMPSSYLVDPKGQVIEVERGFSDERAAALEAKIRALLPRP